MNHLHNAWKPMLLGAVLMLVLVGVAGAVPTDKPSPLSIRRQLVITAADFHPLSDNIGYGNFGSFLFSNANLTYVSCLVPIDFPAPYWVTIDRVELLAVDNNNAGHITAEIYLAKPSSRPSQPIAYIDTGNAFADPTSPRTWSTTAISPNVKNPANDVYALVMISDDDSLYVYGLRIFYFEGK